MNKIVTQDVYLPVEKINWLCEYCGEDVREIPLCKGNSDGVKRSHALGGSIEKAFEKHSNMVVLTKEQFFEWQEKAFNNGYIQRDNPSKDWNKYLEYLTQLFGEGK